MNVSDKKNAGAWHSATWQGAKQEAMCRWAQLPLEKIIAAQEEMQELAQALGGNEAEVRITPTDAKQPHNL